MATVSGSVFMTDNAKNYAEFAYSYPRKPMEVVKSHVDAALEHHGYTADTTISTDYSFDSDNYDDSSSDLVELRDTWRQYWLDGHPDASPHFNLLLLNDNEWPNPDGAGGVATHGDRGDGYPRGGVVLNGVVVGEHSATADRYGPSGDSVEGKIRACVHEIGHNLTIRHTDGLRYDDYVNNFRITRATPMGCTSKTGWQTSCGRSCSTNSTNQWDHYYGDCEASKISNSL